jgi:hypothetical protein
MENLMNVAYLQEIAKFIAKQPADEAVMRATEENYDIPEQGAYDFRLRIMSEIGAHHTLGTDWMDTPSFLELAKQYVKNVKL